MTPPHDALVFCGWHWGETSGTATVLRNLTEHLAAVVPYPVHLVTPPGATGEYPVPKRVHGHTVGRSDTTHAEWLTEFARDAGGIAGASRPLLFFPSIHLPTGALPPFVSILHDVLPLHEWAYRLNPFRRAAYLADIRRHGRAERIFTVSKFAAGDICRQVGWGDGKVTPIRNGVGPEYGRAARARLDGEPPLLAEPYLFYSGDLRKRKNFMTLARAYASLPPHIQRGWALCFTGSGTPLPAILNYFRSMGLADRVHSLKRVSHQDLPRWMAGASLFIFPSLQEGFGLPVAEAQCAGVPVVCGTNSSLPEVSGGHAAFADVRRAEDLARVILEMLEDEQRRRALVAEARSHVETHSWQRAAREYAEALAPLLGS